MKTVLSSETAYGGCKVHNPPWLKIFYLYHHPYKVAPLHPIKPQYQLSLCFSLQPCVAAPSFVGTVPRTAVLAAASELTLASIQGKRWELVFRGDEK